MIINVKQTKSNFKNRFEIIVDNKLNYFAGTPWMKINMPANVDEVRTTIITKDDESICFKACYNIKENFTNSIIPMKWLFTGEQKKYIYNIFDGEEKLSAKFYELINGMLDTKYVMEYGEYTLKIYDVSVGKTRNLLVYNDDLQIAEIVKPLCSSNNLDSYYIFLLDEYSDLQVLISLVTILFDYINYSNSGEAVAYKEEVEVRYTYDKNNKFYNKEWLSSHFNEEDIKLIYNQMEEKRKETISNIKNYAKRIILFFIILMVIIAITVVIALGYK